MVWDARARRRLIDLTVCSEYAVAVRFDERHSRVFVASSDRVVRVLDCAATADKAAAAGVASGVAVDRRALARYAFERHDSTEPRARGAAEYIAASLWRTQPTEPLHAALYAAVLLDRGYAERAQHPLDVAEARLAGRLDLTREEHADLARVLVRAGRWPSALRHLAASAD